MILIVLRTLDVFLLAQEGMAFLLCIDDNHYDHCSDGYDQEDFHVPRIARNSEIAFCNGLTTRKQLCKGR